MTQAKIDLKKLRELASAVPDVSWGFCTQNTYGMNWDHYNVDGPAYARAPERKTPDEDALKCAEYLNEVPPATVLQLLDALDEMRAALEFYADRENWWKPLGAGWASALSKEDCAMWNAGGGRARLAIAKLKEKFE